MNNVHLKRIKMNKQSLNSLHNNKFYLLMFLKKNNT